MEQWVKDIISRLQLEKETVVLDSYPGDVTGRFWKLEGVSKIDATDESCFIYDCSEKDYEFDFDTYSNYMQDEEYISRPIIIFRSWDCEQKIKKDVLSKLNNASEKKQFNGYFERKESIYTDLQDCIELEVEERGMNFLNYEFTDYYNEEDKILSRVYNINFAELKKVFNVTGTYLFRKNVRMGMKKSGGLKETFQKYVKVGAYKEWLKQNPDNEDKISIKGIFELENEDLFVDLPGAFWFLHNGVTLFYYGEQEINYSGSLIKFNPRKISVINGAQTIKNFFEGIDELLEKLLTNCITLIDDVEVRGEIIEFIKEYLGKVSTQIYVKAIFIAGKEKYVQPITYGLNTQLPILQAHIIADSKEVGKINGWLKRGQLKILKEGEVASVGVGFSVLEFIKIYLIAKRKPGRSKNLNRGQLVSYINEVANLVENSNAQLDKLLEDILDVIVVDEWWKQSKSNREKMYSDRVDSLYCNYGKNYFESFVLSEKKGEFDEEYLEILLNSFLQEFKKISLEPDIKDFKNDNLFNKYLGNKSSGRNIEIKVSQEESEKLKEYINQAKCSSYAVHREIMRYLQNNGIELDYFRVIARTDGKARESYPFPTSTFSELIQSIPTDEKSDTHYFEYEKSLFAREIKKKFPVFVIDWENSDEGGRIVKNIEFIPEISFEDYNEEAKSVYEKTVKAFIHGNEDEFPKAKENKFHIRPKGINAFDTFEFTNGLQITKRTFWANNSTVDELLDKAIKK